MILFDLRPRQYENQEPIVFEIITIHLFVRSFVRSFVWLIQYAPNPPIISN